MNSEDQVIEACEAQGVAEPLDFLASVMAGKDPREVSRIWGLLQAIEEENFGDLPTEDQWEEIISIIEKDYKPQIVDIITSQKAAMTLAEYRHPKRKSIELSTEGGHMDVPDLTSEEFDMFEEWFDDQF